MSTYNKAAETEQKLLKISIVFTFILAVSAAVTGFCVNATSIMFDGIYAIIDGFFSLAALFVARLISFDVQGKARRNSGFMSRFHHGFWHLEPLVLTINSASLIGAVLYAFIDSVKNLLSGGSEPEFVPALAFAFFAMILSLTIGSYQYILNKKIESDFLAIDAKSWFISAAINAALLFAFGIGIFLQYTSYQSWRPYIDPLVLALIALAVMPMPFAILRDALKGILLITPKDKDEEVKVILEDIVKRYHFEKAYHYLAIIGRSLVIEIHIILPKHYAVEDIEFFDEIRQEISDRIGEASPDRWFTVSFTTEEKWAI